MTPRTVDWDQIPDSTLLPENLYLMEVDDLTEETSKAGSLMYRATFRVVEPPEYAGTPLYDYFVVGTTDDPTATEDQTWKNSVGVRRMKRLFKSTQIPMTPDVDEMVTAVKQQRFVAAVSQETDDGVRDPKYKGVKRNRVNAMYPVGTRLPGNGPAPTVTAPPAAQPAKPAAAAVPRAPKATATPTVPCPFCTEAIARSQYREHVASKHPDEA